MWYLGIFRLGFEKTIVIFEISTLKFFDTQSLIQISKYLHTSRLEFEKKKFSYSKSTNPNFLKAKLRTKIKILEFRTENALFG